MTFQPELGKIYQGDCQEILRHWDKEFIDLVVTSPPYDGLRTAYQTGCSIPWLSKKLFQIIRPGGVVFWNVDDGVYDGGESLTSFHHAICFVKEAGFKLYDTIIYRKRGCRFPDKTRYLKTFEYCFVFSKGKLKTFNPIMVSSIHAGKPVSGRDRQPDGSLEVRMDKIYPDMKPLDNVWDIDQGWMKSSKDQLAYEHPAIMPEKLATNAIRSWSNPGDVVFDPFMGSGTTAVIAEKMGRKWVGTELEQKYVTLAMKRIDAELAQAKLL